MLLRLAHVGGGLGLHGRQGGAQQDRELERGFRQALITSLEWSHLVSISILLRR